MHALVVNPETREILAFSLLAIFSTLIFCRIISDQAILATRKKLSRMMWYVP